jgi:hypothetical protein
VSFQRDTEQKQKRPEKAWSRKAASETTHLQWIVIQPTADAIHYKAL